MNSTIIVWFRRDLRLDDNLALCCAREDGSRLIPVYVHSPEEEDPWQPGAASRWWLHHSLQSLDGSLQALGLPLLILRGDALAMLMMLAWRTGAGAVYWNRLYDPATIRRDTRVKTGLESIGIQTRSFAGYLLREPWEVLTAAGTPYKVFTPYSRASFQLGDPSEPVTRPGPTEGAASEIEGDDLDSLRLLPEVRWDAGLYDYWQPGEGGAWRHVKAFTDCHLAEYGQVRDRPAEEGISRLSPHLHFGEISPRTLWHSVVNGLAREGKKQGAYPYLRQLLWRDFAHQLLFHFPDIAQNNFKPAFDAFPWRDESPESQAWTQGRTGIPLVDAGMRELWHTGFMHNRVRMIVASFLTKNAGVHWRVGARWFWDTLVDANLANNTMGWQWVAGCGPDAAPYFRIFNPVSQGQRFDPDGEYVRRWIPVLSAVPNRYIHNPWTAPEAVLRDAGVRLGDNYARPILDLKTSRQQALEAYNRHVVNKRL